MICMEGITEIKRPRCEMLHSYTFLYEQSSSGSGTWPLIARFRCHFGPSGRQSAAVCISSIPALLPLPCQCHCKCWQLAPPPSCAGLVSTVGCTLGDSATSAWQRPGYPVNSGVVINTHHCAVRATIAGTVVTFAEGCTGALPTPRAVHLQHQCIPIQCT